MRRLDPFLLPLENNPQLKGWQVDQAEKALRLLCREYLKLPWTGDWLLESADHQDAKKNGVRIANM